MSILQVSVSELRDRRDAKEAFLLLDVREPFEVEVASIAGALTIPMGEIPARLEEIAKDRPVLVLCHHGIRSFQVGHWLRTQGFEDVSNVQGGIDAWSLEIDSSVPRYM